MPGITATFEHLDELSDSEVKAMINVFLAKRDEEAKARHVEKADIFATLVLALSEEKMRREGEIKRLDEDFIGIEPEDRKDDEWTPEA